MKGVVIGLGGIAVVAWSLGVFETPKCDMDGDGVVYRANGTELSAAGRLGYGVRMNDNGSEFYIGNSVCTEADLVDAAGQALPGYTMANKL